MTFDCVHTLTRSLAHSHTRSLKHRPAFICYLILSIPLCLSAQTSIRVNQVGFRPDDVKSAIVLVERGTTATEMGNRFVLIDTETKRRVLEGTLRAQQPAYGNFSEVYVAEFSQFRDPGSYVLQCNGASASVRISADAYRPYLAYPFFYLLEQRCGTNPIFGRTCHQDDGFAVGGPDSGKHVDVVGGYHDASDYLRFLITTSYVSGILLTTYKEYPGLWPDTLDAFGKPGKNQVPDILDEARWGMEWMLKMSAHSPTLYHQSADDRDHSYWDLPYSDSSDYGRGKGKTRPVYAATGKPQGLAKYQNESSGLANIAGRTGAVFALGSTIWKNELHDTTFASLLATRADELYELGRKNPGCSESVPGKAPYRYHEASYADDMEWAAAELYRLTRKPRYLTEGMEYARKAASEGWMGRDTTKHYECFPYVNLGHYALFEFADDAEKIVLASWYREGLLRSRRQAQKTPFNVGVPFIWVSNNVMTGLVTQAILYKKMTGSNEFDDLMFAARDWFFGRNPWGQSFAIGIPENGSYPRDPHSVVAKELKMRLTGALVDGPVYGSIYRTLAGLRLIEPDEFAAFQSPYIVYHDDLGDYSTNEPTIDGTASLIFVLAHWSR
jgi:endoglucanase